jgi:hypothetical protein
MVCSRIESKKQIIEDWGIFEAFVDLITSRHLFVQHGALLHGV